MERVKELANTSLMLHSWFRLLLTSIFVTSKFWEDNAIWNIDYHQIFPDWPVHDMYLIISFIHQINTQKERFGEMVFG